jgi:colanic acid biosynthesis glycosyl transferase WcaI
LLFWAMDLNPDEALAAGWLKKDSRITKYLEAMLRHSLQQAETVVALDRFMSKRIEAKGIAPGKIAVLPPWSHDHTVRYDADGRDRFRAEHGLAGKFVVMYSGNHSPCHPLTTLLEAARRMVDRKDIAFCFVGGGSEFRTVKEFATRHDLDNIVTLPYQPLDKLAGSLSSADLHVVVMGDAYVGIVHPCKVYNIRTLGIPYLYIGPEHSHIGDMNPQFAAGHGDMDRVVQLIRHAAESAASGSVRNTVEHSQDYLLGKMVRAIESGTFQQEELAVSAAQL